MPRKKITYTKSPLDDKYLRRPGQSSDEKIGELEGKRLIWVVLIGSMIGIILVEWMIALVKIPLEPIFLISPTIVVVILVLFSLWKISQLKRQIQNYKMGRDGERAVAERLDNLIRRTHCYVYHDVVLEINKVKFNIDHIIVSTYGLFVVETKTRSKPASGKPTIEFDGYTVKLIGHPIDSSPIQQAQRNVQRLKEKIPSNIIGRPFEITAIIVYPGWWIDNERMRKGKSTWVTNAKYLEFAITQVEPIFTPNEVEILNSKVKEIPGTTSQIIE